MKKFGSQEIIIPLLSTGYGSQLKLNWTSNHFMKIHYTNTEGKTICILIKEAQVRQLIDVLEVMAKYTYSD